MSITTRKRIRADRDPFAGDPFFRYFFRDFGVPSRPASRTQTSLGSGVIVRADGLVVTNNHVVEGADEIAVVLDDRRELAATLVTADERTDLAFLQLQDAPGDLPLVTIGDSDELEVGDLVLAIGNPFGIGQTVTSGIVSAKARTTPGGRNDVSFIQTDAAINPGNSGGALVSLDGELVGVNTAIFTRGGGSIGIGFAIPAALVKAQIRAIDAGGRFTRPWLGASVQPVDPALARTLGLTRPVGLMILDVHPAGAAAAAGLRRGDVVTEVNGVEIYDEQGLNLRLALAPLGEDVSLGCWRDGRAFDTELQVTAAPLDPAPDETRLDGRHPLSGVTVANMSPAYNEGLGLDMLDRGVVVVEVPRRGFAARLRLRPGDRIVGIDGQSVDDVDRLEALLDHRGRRWEIAVRRGDRTFTLSVDS
ncbi:MAG: Do family serine endopeptidase [Geminicoccaceae bacterium]|nr:Do family serine endopeptidase [Geminicoccaceae bacterium]